MPWGAREACVPPGACGAQLAGGAPRASSLFAASGKFRRALQKGIAPDGVKMERGLSALTPLCSDLVMVQGGIRPSEERCSDGERVRGVEMGVCYRDGSMSG